MHASHWLAFVAAITLAASAAQAGDVEAGGARYAQNCIACHGATGKGMASFPALQGRDHAYIEDRLTRYRAREKVGPNSAIMTSLVLSLTDDEIDNLATYISETFQ